mgnify:CR=1 FL=1
MEFDYSPFWFTVIMLVGFFFISLAIYYMIQLAFAEDVYVEDFKDCINKDIPPHICDMIFPPLHKQNV